MPEKLSPGPELPYDVSTGAMASSPDGNGVLLFGGFIYSKYAFYFSIFNNSREDNKTPKIKFYNPVG